MANNTKLPATFRLWEENARVLEPLARLGLNISEVVNEALRENLKRHADRRLKDLKLALANV